MRSGVKSEQGATLAEVRAIGEKVNSVTRTMGIALTACTPPAKGSPLFDLGDDETAVGVDIHGEPDGVAPSWSAPKRSWTSCSGPS